MEVAFIWVLTAIMFQLMFIVFCLLRVVNAIDRQTNSINRYIEQNTFWPAGNDEEELGGDRIG